MGRCDPDIFTNGESILAIDGRSAAVEEWVQNLAKMADTRVDWHFSGGIAHVLHLGDHASRLRVEQAIDATLADLDGAVLRRVAVGESGLYRAGVSITPDEAVAVHFNPLTGQQEFIG